jgi:hypothetical protein
MKCEDEEPRSSRYLILVELGLLQISSRLWEIDTTLTYAPCPPKYSPDSTACNKSLCQIMGQSRMDSDTKPASSKPIAVHQSSTTLILRRGANHGMKDGQDAILAILEHERRVSSYLPPSCAHRKMHHLDSYKGCFGFNFGLRALL